MKKCTTTIDALLRRWHEMLNLSRQSSSFWYRNRIRKKLRKRRIATTFWQKFNEISNVFFFINRIQYDEFSIRKLFFFVVIDHVFVYVYMLTKFILRWNFFRTIVIIFNAFHCNLMREIMNFNKNQKFEKVALRHQIDSMKFRRIDCLLRQIWFFFS